MPGYYLIVNDNEFKNAASEISSYCRNLESALDQYSQIVSAVASSAIISGDVHEALLLYYEYTEKLKTISAGIGEKFSRIVDSFIDDIDRADSYLYLPGVSTRDFSEEEYQHLKDCLDDPWCSITDKFGDWIYSGILGIIDFFHFDSIKTYLQDCHRLLLDYNDETLCGLNTIFNNVHSLDSTYGRSIAGSSPIEADYYTCHFAYASLALCSVRDMMNEMASVIDPAKGKITPKTVRSRLNDLYLEALAYYENLIAVPDKESKPTIEEIARFVESPWSDKCATLFIDPASDFITDLGGIEAAQMVLFQMFGIAKDTFLNNDYKSFILKKQLLNLLEGMSEADLYTGSDEQDGLNEMKVYLKYFKKYGEKAYEYLNTNRYGDDGKLILDGRTVEAKEFREFIGSLGNAINILKYGDKGIDYLSRLLVDYSKGVAVIESFETNCVNDPKMEAVVKEIKALYKKEFIAWAEEAYNQIEEAGFDLTVAAMSKASPVMLVVSAIDAGIGTVGNISGLGPEAKSMYSALNHFNMSTSTENALSNAVEKMRTADPTSEEYERLAADVNNCFSLYKSNIVEMFENMAKASTGTKKAYYKYCVSQANDFSIKNYKEPAIMSYNDYVKAFGV